MMYDMLACRSKQAPIGDGNTEDKRTQSVSVEGPREAGVQASRVFLNLASLLEG